MADEVMGDGRSHRVGTILSLFAVLFCTLQTLFPGLGDAGFSPDYLPNDSWTPDEKWVYLFTGVGMTPM